MCGISIYCDLKERVKRKTLRDMNDIIKHRGPDDEGFALISDKDIVFAGGQDCVVDLVPLEEIKTENYQIGMGQRRLSILDLSAAGHQPMQRGNYTIVFNGEIYNYIELREILKKEGMKFSSNSDTEVIIAAYEKWGEECVNYFNGMWAFCIYDSGKRELFLSRDRFGVKPMYYYKNESKFLFASEIKQILEDKTVNKKLDSEILAHYLIYGAAEYSDETCFKNIKILPAGTNLLIKFSAKLDEIKSWKMEKYYQLAEPKKERSANDIGIALEKSIELRLRSDVALGSCLSGGLDSSSIVAISSEKLKDIKMKTFTSHFPDNAEIDETMYSDAVNNHLKCEGHKVSPSDEDILERLKKVIWHQDEPTMDFHLMVQYEVFKAARENNCYVVLDGQGGDETLAGYYSYYATYMKEIYKTSTFLQAVKKVKAICKASSLNYKELLKYIVYINNWNIRKCYGDKVKGRYLTPKMKKAVNIKALDMYAKKKTSIQHQMFDIQCGGLNALLHHEDRNSMAHSVESRVPFLDYEYVEKALEVPIEAKIADGYTKVPLRSYVEDKLPEMVVWRKNKLGFPAPSEKWVYKIPKEDMEELFNNARSKEIFSIEKLRKIYEKRSMKNAMLRKFIIVELWMRMFELEF